MFFEILLYALIVIATVAAMEAFAWAMHKFVMHGRSGWGWHKSHHEETEGFFEKNDLYAVTFGIGALMSGATGALVAVVFPVTTNLTGTYLGKAFVICVIGGLGSVPGALAGGLMLGVIESFAGLWFGPQHAITVGFVLMILLLIFRPTGLVGRKGYE